MPEQKGMTLPPIRAGTRKLSNKEKQILDKTLEMYKN
jgi:hypothetical protein